MAKGFGVSPITNRIYYGTIDSEKHMWTGKKEDVTDDVIGAVYEWFMGNMEGNEEYSITYPSTEFELVMRRKSVTTDNADASLCKLRAEDKCDQYCNGYNTSDECYIPNE